MLYGNVCFLVCVSHWKESEGRDLKSFVLDALLLPGGLTQHKHRVRVKDGNREASWLALPWLLKVGSDSRQ